MEVAPVTEDLLDSKFEKRRRGVYGLGLKVPQVA